MKWSEINYICNLLYLIIFRVCAILVRGKKTASCSTSFSVESRGQVGGYGNYTAAKTI